MSELSISLASMEHEYRGYEDVLAQGSRSPQRQGMLAEDYEASILDPTTLTTEATLPDGERVRIPQLSSIKNYSWLKQEFYAQCFPEAAAGEKIYQYQDIPNVEPSVEVKQSLIELSRVGGVLTFDYSSKDPEYPNRISELLEEVGVEVSEARELGHQTYLAGKVKLKTGFDPTKPILNLHEAFEKMIADKPRTEDEATYLKYIDPVQTLRLDRLYQGAFAKIEEHPCRQGLDSNEFYEIMTAEPDIAKLVYNVDGEVAILCILGDDLSKYGWLNPDFYKDQFPEEYDRKQILYFPGLAADQEKKGINYTKHIVDLIAQMVEYGNNEILVAFDCCDANLGFLDRYLAALINHTPEASIEFENIDSQTYMALKLAPKES